MVKQLRHVLNRLREARYATGGIRALLIAPVWLIRRHYLVLEMDLSPSPTSEIRSVPLPWEQLTGPALEELLDAFPNLDHETILSRDREGHVCYVCRVDGRLIHHRWYASRPAWLPFLNATWYPESGDYTVVGAFTHPDYRGRGVNTALLQQGLARARGLGLCRVVSFIAGWNAPSLTATRRAGLRQSGTVTLWNLGLIRWHSCSGSARISKGRLTIERTSPIP